MGYVVSLRTSSHRCPLPTTPCVNFSNKDVFNTSPSQCRRSKINVPPECTRHICISSRVHSDRGSIAIASRVAIYSLDPLPIAPSVNFCDEEINRVDTGCSYTVRTKCRSSLKFPRDKYISRRIDCNIHPPIIGLPSCLNGPQPMARTVHFGNKDVIVSCTG